MGHGGWVASGLLLRASPTNYGRLACVRNAESLPEARPFLKLRHALGTQTLEPGGREGGGGGWRHEGQEGPEPLVVSLGASLRRLSAKNFYGYPTTGFVAAGREGHGGRGATTGKRASGLRGWV